MILYGLLDRRIEMETNKKSILIGNGLDIQVGGNDYLNNWIMVRLLAKLKMGKYDLLFSNIISGDEIIFVFNNMIGIANKAREGEYEKIIDNCEDKELSNDLKKTLYDFNTYHKKTIKSVDEIGMEDWIMLFQLYLLEPKDLLGQYKSIKQGYQQMILDAIFCEGKIQKLHEKLGKKAKDYFGQFDNIFTLNYDSMIEKATRQKVFHLHGDFNTLHFSENPQNAYGYYRRKNKLIKSKSEWKHCNSTAILDFNGNLKYKFAIQQTTLYNKFENDKQLIYDGKISEDEYLSSIQDDCKMFVKIGIDKNLYLGNNYYFDKFEDLSGELSIIGLSPYNDSHIFECINRSNLDFVKFYYFFNTSEKSEIEKQLKTIKLNINKPYEIFNINDLWQELDIFIPQRKVYNITNEELKAINMFGFGESLTKQEILYQVNNIPSATRDIIIEMLNSELTKEKYHRSSKDEKELIKILTEFGRVLNVASLSPQVLFFLFFENYNSRSKRS